ncbi:glucose 1-dehydrogenase/3-oxoacyl-[acyl-carrier protein] reductase [Burkholderia sp. GAS332]|nr:glucose 1-dehydrogenase/3-oxoacyl-[acyl-carrier protein] reductase [Burkholderia sp. GAS332]
MSLIDRTSSAGLHMSLHGRTALFTGASLGIGREIARLLAQYGARVALHYGSAADARAGQPDAAQQLVEELHAAGTEAVAIEFDLVCADAGNQLAPAANGAIGAPDVVVLRTSDQAREIFDQIAVDLVRQLSRVNLEASIEILQAVLSGTRAPGWAASFLSAACQVRPDPEPGIYAPLKAAQHNLIANVAKACATDSVTADTISPGLIATPRNAWHREDEDAPAADRIQSESDVPCRPSQVGRSSRASARV